MNRSAVVVSPGVSAFNPSSRLTWVNNLWRLLAKVYHFNNRLLNELTMLQLQCHGTWQKRSELRNQMQPYNGSLYVALTLLLPAPQLGHTNSLT